MEAHTVPHFKATINTKVWPEQLGSDGISISYKARPKIGHLLHKTGFVYSDMHTTVDYHFLSILGCTRLPYFEFTRVHNVTRYLFSKLTRVHN